VSSREFLLLRRLRRSNERRNLGLCLGCKLVDSSSFRPLAGFAWLQRNKGEGCCKPWIWGGICVAPI
jgi:hypothetical protein